MKDKLTKLKDEAFAKLIRNGYLCNHDTYPTIRRYLQAMGFTEKQIIIAEMVLENT